MRTFLVSYELARPAASRPSLAEAIMTMAGAWARPLDNVWYVRAEESAAEIEARLARHIEDGDGLIVQETRGEGLMLNTGLRWFRQRRVIFAAPEARTPVGPDLARDPPRGNVVVAFPAQAAATGTAAPPEAANDRTGSEDIREAG